MKVLHDATHVAEAFDGPCVTVGNFDGVHRGHRSVIERARELANELGRPCVAITFRPHPAAVLSDAGPPERLTSDLQQREQLAELGLDALLCQPFDTDFAKLAPEEFFGDFLVGALRASGVVVGSSFRFGAGRRGDVAVLERLAGDGLRVVGVSPVVLGGEPVSSTRIRELLHEGRPGEAAELLGRPFALEGRVVRGDGRGRQLGFPTANIEPREVMVPATGVYATLLQRDEQSLPSVTNVGRRPTFGPRAIGVETHVFDFDGNLYDERVRLQLLHRIRGERRFDSADELVAQIGSDQETAKRLLEAHSDTPE